MGVIGTVCKYRIRLGIGNIGERPVDLGLRRRQGRSFIWAEGRDSCGALSDDD